MLQRRIAARIRAGRTLADVQDEIIVSSSLRKHHRSALRLFARGLVRAAARRETPAL
jgi:hypothetical protein